MNRFFSFNSKNKGSGQSTSDFSLKLNQPIEDVRMIKGMQVNIPYSWYMVMTGINDKIYITVAGPTTYTATLTQGNYTITALEIEIQTQLNAAYTPDNLFTVAYDDVLLYKVTITHGATAFSLSFATNTTASARKLIGFSKTDTALALSHLGDEVYNVSHDSTLYLRSYALSRLGGYVNGEVKPFIMPIPVQGQFGDRILWRALGESWNLSLEVGS